MALDLRLAVSDLTVGEQPIKVKCPDRLHKARTGGKADKQMSLGVYPDHLHCYGCKLHVEIWDDVKASQAETYTHPLAILLDVSNEEALGLLARYDSDSLDAYRERAAQEARTDPLPSTLATIYSNVLLDGPRRERKDWLYARGLDDRMLRKASIGHDGNRFVIPVFSGEGNLISLRYRRDDPYYCTCDQREHTETCGVNKYPKYLGTKGRNGLYLYPEPFIEADTRDYLVITEGELDALRLWQEDIPAISATNGAGQAPKLPALIKERWPRIKTLYIATDQDEPGQEAARLTGEAAKALGFATVRITWNPGKDVTDAIQLGTLNPASIRR